MKKAEMKHFNMIVNISHIALKCLFLMSDFFTILTIKMIIATAVDLYILCFVNTSLVR